jgi:sigma-B regulation protein RsbU (phosphoserine phosphatase)
LTYTLENKLHLKELELNSLLEITQAINNNLPEEHLYKIYNFILRANLNIKKLLLCIKDQTWQRKVNFGTKANFSEIHEEISLLNAREVSVLQSVNLPTAFKEFDLVIPVFHKENILAYVFVGELGRGIQEEEATIDTTFVQTLTNIIVVAIENKKLARRQLEQEAFNRELQIAQQVQSMLFPKNLPYKDILKVKADYLPHHSVGGDYYDFIRVSEDIFLMCIADVSGKGVPAALLMSNFQASLRILVRQTTDLKEIIRELNFALYQVSGGERFITLFCAIYDRKQRKLSYVNAGHNPPIFCDEGNCVSLLEKGTTVLGIFHPLPFLEKTEVENVNEFLLFSYTDGLVEATNHADEEFGAERILDFVDLMQQEDPQRIHEEVMTAVETFRSGKSYADDVTIFTVKVGKQ